MDQNRCEHCGALCGGADLCAECDRTEEPTTNDPECQSCNKYFLEGARCALDTPCPLRGETTTDEVLEEEQTVALAEANGTNCCRENWIPQNVDPGEEIACPDCGKVWFHKDGVVTARETE